MGHSEKCKDLTTRLDRITGRCVPCDKPGKGHETTPNCGYDDHGGRHEMDTKKCSDNTFNDGTHYLCQPCSLCAPDLITVTPCNANADTKCQAIQHTSTISVSVSVSATTTLGVTKVGLSTPSWVMPLVFTICTTLMVLSCWAICVKRKRGYRRSSHMSAQFTPLPAAQETTELNYILSSDILAAPLQCVLDNLDVLEDLVILLDPETHGTKNTKHLASLCKFSAKWVTYTYSLKDSKSPLKALLEGVSSRHPEWTVGHLAELLRQIERIDALVVLGKLRPDKLDIITV